MLYTRTTNCCGCLRCVFVCWLCFGFPDLSFRSWPYSLRFLLRTRYVVFVFFFVLSVSISSGSGTTPLFLLFILFILFVYLFIYFICFCLFRSSLCHHSAYCITISRVQFSPSAHTRRDFFLNNKLISEKRESVS